ncbi:Squalene/phytoene synthase [Parasponia andersonii]|uniref:Squalene/phytoene synthase n=1 Tax=Parasponia andersonii TaxID=3476 RepID=A0A2P5AJM2_PARAD|nr:Squalene/phytoene synthase [Parasponia andersonii]
MTRDHILSQREEYNEQAEKLIHNMKDIIVETEDLKTVLELINSIRKLGLTLHFEKEVKGALGRISCSNFYNNKSPVIGKDLYLTSIYFRLLRQHGYQVSQDIFRSFNMDKNVVRQKIAPADTKVMLELLEASYLAIEGEDILDEAKAFAEENLKITAISSNLDNNKYVSKLVAHALELPSHWRVPWFDVKWQTKAYDIEKDMHMNSTTTILVNLAKLNFNMVQATLQKDLRELSSWWKNLGLSENLNFARDRLVESFMCTVGLAFQPQYKCLRKWLTKVVIFILIIDDVYDLYGSLEELRQFTNAVDRWDFRETEQLPECMKICFQALYQTTCQTADEIETKNGCKLVLPHLQKVWADFCKSLLMEAEWYNRGYIPSLEEYLSNACISSSGPMLLLHSYFAITRDAPVEEMSDFLNKNQDLVYHISLVIRLCNDIGTSAAEQERGDAASSILCYMQEMKVSEEVAREHIRGMINKTWKKINKKCFSLSQLPTTSTSDISSFINITLNTARVAHSLYQSGDAFSAQETDNKTQILSLLVEPLISQ